MNYTSLNSFPIPYNSRNLFNLEVIESGPSFGGWGTTLVIYG
jgi:hypothetical protein